MSKCDFFNDGSSIFHFSCDNTSNDSCGLLNPPVWTGTEQYGDPLINNTGKSFLFDGLSYFESTENTVSIPVTFSFSFWVKIDDTSETRYILFLYLPGGGTSLDAFYAGGTIRIRPNGNIGDGILDIPYVTGETTLCTITYDGSVLKTYKNGVINQSFDTVFDLPNTSVITIGTFTGSNNMLGYIDDIRMFNKTLTEDEVLMLFNETSEDRIAIGTSDVDNILLGVNSVDKIMLNNSIVYEGSVKDLCRNKYYDTN